MKFEFLIKTVDGEVWTQLQGNGGQIGNGSLHIDVLALPEQKRKDLLRSLLARVRRELQKEGCLYVWKGDDLPPAERIVRVEAADVLDVRFGGESLRKATPETYKYTTTVPIGPYGARVFVPKDAGVSPTLARMSCWGGSDKTYTQGERKWDSFELPYGGEPAVHTFLASKGIVAMSEEEAQEWWRTARLHGVGK